MLKEILNPDLYHGSKKKRNFFEGWYFKICDKEDREVFALIPGIALGEEDHQHHSFIQVLDGDMAEYDYIRYEKEEFQAEEDEFRVTVGGNEFSLDGINLNLNHDGCNLKGKLSFKNILKWEGNALNPGSMGIYNYFKCMECYSQVCVLQGDIRGELEIDREMVDFTGGKVYIEKNWGMSFPEWWIWVQSNSFMEDASITCSVGQVPFKGFSFKGFLVNFVLEGKEYRFTTMNRSRFTFKKVGDDMELEFWRKNLKLKLKTYTDKQKFMLCMAPVNGKMVPLVRETLKGRVHVKLIDTKKEEVIFEGDGINTGVEYGGRKAQIS